MVSDKSRGKKREEERTELLPLCSAGLFLQVLWLLARFGCPGSLGGDRKD